MGFTTNRSNMYYGSTSELNSYIGQQGEIALDIQTNNLKIMNGISPGGSYFSPVIVGTLTYSNLATPGHLTVGGYALISSTLTVNSRVNIAGLLNVGGMSITQIKSDNDLLSIVSRQSPGLAQNQLVSRSMSGGTILNQAFINVLANPASATISIDSTQVNINSSILRLTSTNQIQLDGLTKLSNGLQASATLQVSGFTLSSSVYTVAATLDSADKTFFLPNVPTNGETFLIKAVAVVSGGSGKLIINGNGKQFDGDPRHNQIELLTSGTAPGGFVQIVFNSTLNIWLILSNYRADFIT